MNTKMCLDLHRVRAGARRRDRAGQRAAAPTRSSASRCAGPPRRSAPTATRSPPRWRRSSEQALGGEYTITVQPYATPTVAMKAVMDGNGEIAYTADIGMTQFVERGRRLQGLQAAKPEIVHTWYAYPMESMMATTAKNARDMQVLEGLQRQAGVLHPGRLHELAQLPAHLQGAQLRLQARPDRPQGERRRARGRHRGRFGRLHHVGLAALVVLEGDRDPHGRTRGQSVRRRGRQAQGRRALRWSTSIPRARSPRTSAPRRSRACRSCSPITPASICRRTSSTRWSRRSMTRRTIW